ncbi:MAG: LysR family transcriptional regulator [Selenomonadaceae bacterium]|nr:LysR family transcriptional regulator [Selenomonadaceae bacterium]
MEIRVLRYFLEVARRGGLTKASAHLHVSQPTLSRQLKELEEELGKKLFVRSNYSIHLTEEGLLLKKRAEDILGMVDKVADEFRSMGAVSGGDIHIGCAESEGFAKFVKIIKGLQADYPRIRYHLYSSDSESVTEKLDRGILDFAIIAHEPDRSKYNSLPIPYKNRWGLILRRDDVLAEKEAIQKDDLAALPLICSRQGLDEELMAWLGETQDRLNIVATYDMIFNASIMAKEGFGYVLGYDKIIATGEDRALCFRPLAPLQESSMYVIWRKYNAFTPVALLLLEEMGKQFSVAD